MKYIYTLCAAAACLLIGQAVLSTTFAAERRANGSFPFGLRTSMENKMAISEHRRLKSVDLVGGSSTPPANRLPLQECEGDCDRDRDCDDGLACFQRGPGQAVPGCSGGSNDRSNSDYCIRKDSSSTGGTGGTDGGTSSSSNLKKIGDNGSPSSAYPLGMCEGDCDSDRDCDDGLVCDQRRPYESVPGCSGGTSDSSHTDYCVKGSTSGVEGGSSGGSGSVGAAKRNVRLKLYWEPGYDWQEESKERKWCVMYDYDGLPGDGKCWYGLDRRSCKSDQLYMAKCSGSSRQKFDIIEQSNGEVQIRLGNGKNKCLERDGRKIELHGCSSSNSKQLFYIPNGSLGGRRFELSQRSYSSQCVTQDHHPKAGEVLEMHSCRAARSKSHSTSYWELY